MVHEKILDRYDEDSGLPHYKIKSSCPKRRWYHAFFDIWHSEDVSYCWNKIFGSKDCVACMHKYKNFPK